MNKTLLRAASLALLMSPAPFAAAQSASYPAKTVRWIVPFSPGGSVNACVGGLGVNRAYAVDACNGRPVFNLDASTEPGPPCTCANATHSSAGAGAPRLLHLRP